MPNMQSHVSSAFGLFAAPIQAYLEGLEAVSQNMGPMKTIMRSQLELFGLANRRAQAYLEFTSKLGSCSSPQEFFTLQSDFWRRALEQYGSTSRRVMDAWSHDFAASGFEYGRGAQSATHDYITFPARQERLSKANGGNVHSLGRRVA